MSTIETIKALNSLSKGINPTIIYNEGWMIRLLVIESMIEKLQIESIDFEKLSTKHWSSEALITSPFVNTKGKREGYTHADIIMGDFFVDYEKRGDVKLNDNPEILGIIEAKMGSNLSQGTKNAKDYNQGSRTICCLSHLTKEMPNCELFFIVVAPNSKIDKIKKQIDRKKIESQIEERFKLSSENYSPDIQEQVKNCKILSISYDEWIEKLQNEDVKDLLNEFYKDCLKHNKIKK